jgi:uncharacterized delta-60 repeat protein
MQSVHVIEGVPEPNQLTGTRVFSRAVRCQLLILCAALSTLPAFAQAGKLDPSFGSGGVFVASGPSFPNAPAAAIQSNGKILAAGQFNGLPGVARLTPNGALDPTFGNNGVATTSIDEGEIPGSVGIGLQSTGKIVIGLSTLFGTNSTGFTLVRFNANGTFDTSFGSGGLVTVSPFNQLFRAPCVLAIQSNDEIVLAGSEAVARFTPNGALDTSFGTDGFASVPFASITSLAIEASGDILLGTGSQILGPTPPQGANTQGAVVRLLANGAVDTSFGIAGQVATLPAAAAIAVLSNGEIVVAGTQHGLVAGSSTLFQMGYGVVRFHADGAIDMTFGTNGGAFVAFSGFPIVNAYAAVIQANGDVVVAGDAVSSTSLFNAPADFALARFTSQGALDTTFGSGGKVTTSLGSGSAAFITSLAVQNGNLIAAGVDGINGGVDGGAVTVARYH